jgi:ketol-acid reductoisomerase
MRWSISETAEWGDYVSGPRIVTSETKAEMKRILAEIQDGSFAKRWMEEYDAGLPNYKKFVEEGHNHPIEKTGAKLRPLMSWIEG